MPRDDYNIGDNEKNKNREGFIEAPRGGRSGEKAKDFGKTIMKLIKYCKSYIPLIILALALSAVAMVFAVIGPNEIRKITDIITAGVSGGSINLAAIGKIGILLAVLYGLSFVFGYFQGVIMAFVSQQISKKLRMDISRKINRIPIHFYDKVSYGDVLSRVTNDVDTISQSLSQSIASLVSSSVMFVGLIAIMLSISVVMTLTAVVSTLIGFGVLFIVVVISQKYFNVQQQYLGKLNGHIEEIYAGHSTVKVYNGTESAKETFREINSKMYEGAWKSQFMTGIMMPFLTFIDNLGYVGVCIVGAVLVMNGNITFGVIVAFTLYARQLVQPLGDISQASSGFQSVAAAGERVFEFLEQPELSDESGKTLVLERVKGEIEFEHVKFGYAPDKTIIHDFSAKAAPGQKIAIIGPTGAGKTTIVNLLMRFYETEEGKIKIDGIPISDLTRENIRSQFCMVLQDTWLFEGTIRENITYNKQSVTDAQLDAACKAVGLNHFISTLPNGYDTELGDKANLSVGQMQLITIARAMIENAPLLILDEATSSVDTRTEVLIQEAMDKLMAGRTSFVIAHRLSTIRNADLILVMRDGDIIESGTHDELMEQNGFYTELYNSQFEQAS